MHRAVALYKLKDLDGALTGVKEALKLDPQHKRLLEEYVRGRILEAKGDAVPGPVSTWLHISNWTRLRPT